MEKYRGKSSYNGKWVYGDLIHYGSGEMAILQNPFSKYGCEATELEKRELVDPSSIERVYGGCEWCKSHPNLRQCEYTEQTEYSICIASVQLKYCPECGALMDKPE